MERKMALTAKTKAGLMEVFIMLGDYGLPERSHLLARQSKLRTGSDGLNGHKDKDRTPHNGL